MENCDDATELHTMNLSDEYELIVSDMQELNGPDYVSDGETLNRLSSVFKLNISIEGSNTSMQLNFPGIKTVLDVKNDLFVSSLVKRDTSKVPPLRYMRSNYNNSFISFNTGYNKYRCATSTMGRMA